MLELISNLSGIKIWNNLSPEIKSITNKIKFMKIIRKKLISET